MSTLAVTINVRNVSFRKVGYSSYDVPSDMFQSNIIWIWFSERILATACSYIHLSGRLFFLLLMCVGILQPVKQPISCSWSRNVRDSSPHGEAIRG
jgi:hypothetical protein